MQVHKNACLAPSDSPEYHAPVHAVVGMAGQGLSHNRASRTFFVCGWEGRRLIHFAPRGSNKRKQPQSNRIYVKTTGPEVVPPIFEYADDRHFGLTLLNVNRTHLTVTLRSAGSEGAGDGGPLGRVLDSYTLVAKSQPQAPLGAGGSGGTGRRTRGVRVGVEEALL